MDDGLNEQFVQQSSAWMVHGVTRLNNNGQSSGGRLRVFSSYPRSGTMVLLTVEIDSLRIEVLYGPNLTEEEHARIPQEENLFIKGTRSDSRIVDEIRRFHFHETAGRSQVGPLAFLLVLGGLLPLRLVFLATTRWSRDTPRLP